jgi:hypothetical protein
LGEKWEEVKKNLFLLLLLATKWGSSFLLFKRVKLDHFALSFLDIIFNSNLESSYFHDLLG